MVGLPTAAVKTIKVLAMIGAAIFVINLIHQAGQDSMLPTIADLQKRYDKVHTDMSILNAEVVTSQAGTQSNLTMIGKDSEIENVKIQVEVNRRVELFLDQLASNRMHEGSDSVHPSTSSTYSLSRFAKSLSDSCTGKTQLYRDLSRADERIAREILLPYDQAQADLKICRDYTQRVDADMQSLKAELAANEKKIKDSQP